MWSAIITIFFRQSVLASPKQHDHLVFQERLLKPRTRQDIEFEPIDWDTILPHEGFEGKDRDRLIALLDRNRDVFSVNMGELGTVSHVEHEITIQPGARIVRQRPYRLAQDKQIELDRQIDEMLKNDIIERSESEWSSPAILVRKKDLTPGGKPRWRVCIDYRALNKITVPTFFPIPNFQDLADNIAHQHPKWYSVCDLMGGYNQISVAESSRDYTTFNTGRDCYRYKRLPFGLSYALLYSVGLCQFVLRTWDHSLLGIT